MTQIIENEIAVGDIFYRSWGYDQTNINFVKVIEISKTGKTVKAAPIGQNIVEGSEGFMSESVTPDTEHLLSDKTFRAIIAVSHTDSKPILKGNGDYYWKYDGKPLYQSHYA